MRVKACAAGYTAEDYEKTCTACDVGEYKPLEGFFSCIACEIGTYNNATAQSKCVTCGAFKTTATTGSTSLDDCDCEKGYYRRNGSTTAADCWACPTGATCPGGAELPIPKPGYWWDAETTASQNGKIALVQCSEPIPEIRCPGNLTLEGRCAMGYDGVACISCLKGLYFKSGSYCKECNNDVQLRFIIVVVVVVIIALVLFKFAQLKVSHLSSISIAVSYFQIIAVFTVYNFEWPASLQQAFDTLKFFNLNLDIFVPECIQIITYGLKWGLTIAMPVFFAFLLVVAFGLESLRSFVLSTIPKLKQLRIHPKILSCYNVDHPNVIMRMLLSFRRDTIRLFLVPRSKRELLNFGDKFIHTFIVVISFSYVFVITKAAEIFDCRSTTQDNVTRFYVSSDTTLFCFEDSWWVYFTFALLTFIFFGLGTIILFAYIVYKKNETSSNAKFYARFRFLFVRFRNGRLFWEIIIILRKLAISAAIIFFSTWPILVVLFTMFVIFISFILQTHHVPYRRLFHNIMEYIVLLSTEFLLFSGLLFYVNDFPDEATGSALGYLCILAVIFSSAAIIVLIGLDFLSQYLADRRLRKEMEEQKKNKKQMMEGKTSGDIQNASSIDIELKDENSQQPNQVELVDNNSTTITIVEHATPEPVKLSRKQRFVTFVKTSWTRFTEYLKKIEGENLDADLEEYDDDRLWDVELLDRGLPIPQKQQKPANADDSTIELEEKKDSNKTQVELDENEIKLQDDKPSTIETEDDDSSSDDNRTPQQQRVYPPNYSRPAVDPKTFSRLIGRSESDLSSGSASSQRDLLGHNSDTATPSETSEVQE